MTKVGEGTSRPTAARASYDTSMGNISSVVRKGRGISQVLKTLGIAKVEPSLHVNVGKDESSGSSVFNTASKFEGLGIDVDGEPRPQRTLGVSLLGGCSSKGCPTKSVENEDRFVHGKIKFDMNKLRGLGEEAASYGRNAKTGTTGSTNGSMVPCWAFATFDGHAGPACAHFLKENFMTHLRRHAGTRCQVVEMSHPRGKANAAAGKRWSGVGMPPRDRHDGDDSQDAGMSPRKPSSSTPTVEVVLARLLTDTLGSLTREFETKALLSGEISGACVISGLYCQGALVLANVGDCQAAYHGQVKSAPGSDPVTAQTTVHDATNPAEVNRFIMAGGFMSSSRRFQGVLEPSRTVGDVDVKAAAPPDSIASFPELFKVDIASQVFRGDEKSSVPPFLVLATDGIWDEASANTVVEEVKDGIAKIQAHKRRFAVRWGKHRRESSLGSTTFTDGESDSESEDQEREFCGSGEWAEQGMDLAERVVSLARGRYDDATALVVVFE